MTKNEFYEKLNRADLEVVFKKRSDDSLRTIRCTRLYPEFPGSDKIQKTRDENIVTVYDMTIREWRSFYLDSIQSIKELETNYEVI